MRKERLKYAFYIEEFALLCPSGVARPIIQDCHSCDSGSNPDSGAIIIINNNKAVGHQYENKVIKFL